MSGTSTGPPLPFSSLPTPESAPKSPFNAWSVYGSNDELGFLNRQTPALVAAAASSEIKSGHRVALDAALDFQGSTPIFGRQMFHKDVYQKTPRIVHDDTWTFNTQSSTQWDGLRHFGYQKAQRFYNDTTLEDIAGTSDKGSRNPNILGVQNAVQHGGVAGRGVLVDIHRWLQTANGKYVVGSDTTFHPLQSSGIPLDWLKQCLADQNTHIQYGDILFVRSGFMSAYRSLTHADIEAKTQESPPQVCGVAQSLDTIQWIWENFSAVAGDQPAFEQWPPQLKPELGNVSMHEILLAGWGCPIGELFDLEALSKHCQEQNRWTFFLSSQLTHVPGGVASPGNAVAIF